MTELTEGTGASKAHSQRMESACAGLIRPRDPLSGVSDGTHVVLKQLSDSKVLVRKISL